MTADCANLRSQQAALVLGSASPRRLELLRQVGVEPDICDPAEIDESPKRGELPADYAKRMAQEKLDSVSQRHDGAYVIAADTVVALGRRILGKPDDSEAARRFLTLLSGRSHRVLGAVAVRGPDGRVSRRLVTTRVHFRRLHADEIAAYVAADEWQGKAGGYAIQGNAAAFIPDIGGSYPNVVGLPLVETLGLLRGLGWRG